MTKNNKNQEINFPEKPVTAFDKEGNALLIKLDGTVVQLENKQKKKGFLKKLVNRFKKR
jgi:hypothetical protein